MDRPSRKRTSHRALPFLSVTLFRIEGFRVQLCRVLQHASTLLGLWILLRAVRRVAETAPPPPSTTARTAWTPGARLAVASVLVLAPVVVAFAWRSEEWNSARGFVDLQTAMFFTARLAIALSIDIDHP